MRNLIFLTAILFTLFSCGQQNEVKNDDTAQAETKVAAVYPEVLSEALEAHGGLETWQSFGTLEYEMVSGDKSEYQLFDLKERKSLIISDAYKLGFDGTQAWVVPSKEAMGRNSIRFYHNLNFYFFAIPFVLTDPGIQYEEMEDVTMDNVDYKVLKISYEANVGDSPDDNYVCYFNKETKMLDFIRYTVTYFSKESSDKFNALKYDEWQEVNGLKVPLKMSSYKWEDGQFGEIRGEKTFKNVVFSEGSPLADVFTMPKGAEVESTPAN
ncbi:MAG: hypothetical protein CMO01_05110 [Thalassobius sp.]|nr:hypothetical protein [Thalassovita sp.]